MGNTHVKYPPVTPLAEAASWTAALTRIASEPLELCPDFPTIARRHEAWWNQEMLDRPIFFYRKVNWEGRKFGRHLDLLNQPERWLEEMKGDLLATAFPGDEVPSIRVDFGPVLLGGLLGGRVEFGADTTWTHPFINDDWSNLPQWRLNPANQLWKQYNALMEIVANDAKGRYLVRTPDWGGSADVLLNLRGSEALCLDVLDKPEIVKKAVDAIYPVWHRAFRSSYESALARGAGIVHWAPFWSNRPYFIPACDFSFMIGPKQFNSIFLPDIARQVDTVGRSIFHLDGPGAANHIDALLDLPNLTAIQYVPGQGTPSILPWMDMFKNIQAKGKSIQVLCPPEEILTVCDMLKPEGLAIFPAGPSKAWGQMDEIFKAFCARYRCKA